MLNELLLHEQFFGYHFVCIRRQPRQATLMITHDEGPYFFFPGHRPH